MQIRKIKSINIGCRLFKVVWNKNSSGASFDYADMTITIGTRNNNSVELLDLIIHELTEILAEELHIRFYRTDVQDDYIFMYDHRQHTTLVSLLAGLVAQFII